MNKDPLVAAVVTGTATAGSLLSWAFLNGGAQFLVLLIALAVGIYQLKRSKAESLRAEAERLRAEAELRDFEARHPRRPRH